MKQTIKLSESKLRGMIGSILKETLEDNNWYVCAETDYNEGVVYVWITNSQEDVDDANNCSEGWAEGPYSREQARELAQEYAQKGSNKEIPWEYAGENEEGVNNEQLAERKQTIKLNESQLRNIIREAINEIDYSNFDFSKTRGIDLSDTCFGVTPREVKEKVLALQKAITDVMEMMNGAGAGKAFDKEMWNKCYDFNKFISKYYVELKTNYADLEGSWEEDHSDIPFMRKMDDDYGIPNYYDKEGKVIDRKTFRTNFKPHARKVNESKIHNDKIF